MLAQKIQRNQVSNVSFTVAQASVITGVPQKDINQYIDRDFAGMDIASAGQGARSIRLDGLLALRLSSDYADTLTLAARVHLTRLALAKPKAKTIDLDGKLTVTIAPARKFVVAGLRRYGSCLSLIKSDPAILSGEHCLKGTRISVYTIAGLCGTSGRDEVMQSYDITDQQLDAACVFAEANPRRGRPKSVEAKLATSKVKGRRTKSITIKD